VYARGLCRLHYHRAAHGQALDPDDGHQVGITASGYGTWGVLDVGDDGRLMCHECGRTYVALGVHVGMVHCDVRAYRLEHGLTMSTSLAARELSERLADAATKNGGAARLAPSRRTFTALAQPDPALVARGLRIGGRSRPRA